MNILVVTNLYPPYVIGGYEVGCQTVVEYLVGMGHEVTIITSRYGKPPRASKLGVTRCLFMQPFIPSSFFRKVGLYFLCTMANWWQLRKSIQHVRPDVIYGWNLGGLGLATLTQLTRAGPPLALCLADYWLKDWKSDLGWRLVRKLSGGRLGKLKLYAANVHFCSRFLLEATAKEVDLPAASEVIPWAIDPSAFAFRPREKADGKILYVGQVVHHKGVHTAVRALARLKALRPGQNFSLTIVGGSAQPSYLNGLKALTVELGLNEAVQFVGAVARENLPILYAEHDIQVFPSIWDEPFGLTMLEGMASGLGIVGTGSGGSGEVMQNENNSLLFTKGDELGCAEAILRMVEDEALFQRVQKNARRCVEQSFGLAMMGSRCEEALRQAVANANNQAGRTCE